MSEQFLGEIRMFGFGWAPKSWAVCDGGLLPVNSNQALYSLLGTQFGGDGSATFGLPNFKGRMPVEPDGQFIRQGGAGGQEYVTLNSAEMPAHTHALNAVSTVATAIALIEPVVLAQSREPSYIPTGTPVAMNPATCSSVGGNQAHSNIQPSLCVGFCIALQGLYPSRN